MSASPDDDGLTPRQAFEIADYLCSALSPLVKPSVRTDLANLKFHLWDIYSAESGGSR